MGPSEPVTAATIKKVTAWTNWTVAGASPDIPPSRAPSQRVVRRAPSRKLTRDVAADSNESTSQYEDDGRLGGFDMVRTYEQAKVRVKIHYQDEVRGMAVPLETSFEELTDLITLKFGKSWDDLRLKFRDEDGGKISLKDPMDWDMAIEVARGTGGPLKALEMWLTES